MGEGEGGMIWESGTEPCILLYVKRIASPVSMHGTGCSGLVHWDDPEEWGGEGAGGDGFRMGGKMIIVTSRGGNLFKNFLFLYFHLS